MAKFFFNFRQGNSYQTDDLGCEFETVEEAYLGAFRAGQDMWSELLIKRQDPLLCAFEVMDEDGRDLFALPFVEILDACRGREYSKKGPSTRPPAIQQAINHRAEAHRIMREVSTTVADARATLRETWHLLGKVSKIS